MFVEIPELVFPFLQLGSKTLRHADVSEIIVAASLLFGYDAISDGS